MDSTSTINIFQHSKDAIEFKQGDVIFNMGDPGDVMYVILDGVVDVIRDGVKIDEVHPGRVFGEMALIRKSAAIWGGYRSDRFESSTRKCPPLPVPDR